MLHRLLTNLPEPHDVFRHTLSQCLTTNPNSERGLIAQTLYLHVGPFSRYVIREIGLKIERLDAEEASRRCSRANRRP
jgi:hypothetical protein